MNTSSEQIVPGLVLSASGQASVDSSLTEVLFDLALALEDQTGLPVDMQHALAAIVLAVRAGQLSRNEVPAAEDPATVQALVPHARAIFEQHEGRVGRDD